jgi:PAS domain S-box-containing protein
MSLPESSTLSLGRKVTVWILLISGIFTLCASGLQLYMDYQNELKGIENTLSIIEKSHIASLEHSAWFMNEQAIETHIEEMLKLPHIAYLDLQLKGMKGVRSGVLPRPNLRVRNAYHLYAQKAVSQQTEEIGQLVVTASLEEVYATIKDKVVVILISQSVKTFFVSFFILFLIHSLITRHLFRISQYVTNISINSPGDRLELNRNKMRLHLHKPDELDLLVNKINTMQTDLQNSLAALKKRERDYREIFNATSDGIFILEGKSGAVIDVNDPMLTMYGYEKDEVLGRTPVDFSAGVPPYDEAGVNEKISQVLAGETQIFEFRAKKKNGDLFWVEVSPKLSKIGDQYRIIAVVRDIDERKKTQEMMVQSEKMLSVGGLAAGMAHEINNPLAGMMQTADVIRKRLTDPLLPANIKAAEESGLNMEDIFAFMEKRGIPQMADAINASGRRAASIVNNMLSFARKSSTRNELYNLNELIDKTFELAASDFDLKQHYDFKTIEIRKQYDQGLPLVPCEGPKIQQVLLNILRNGAQAMQEGGTAAPRFTVSTYVDMADSMACIKICDNGPGMNPDTLKRVFEPFFTTKPVGVGTGLGLSVSYFIITENHGGELLADSPPGQGASFVIRLPLESSG